MIAVLDQLLVVSALKIIRLNKKFINAVLVFWIKNVFHQINGLRKINVIVYHIWKNVDFKVVVIAIHLGRNNCRKIS